jgi:hypothetical protein
MDWVVNDLLDRLIQLREAEVNTANKGWTGVDLDGTLAYYDGWKGSSYIGEPVTKMVDRVIKWVKKGRNVKIFTARVSEPDYDEAVIQAWLEKVGIGRLPVTNVKDMHMIELWDDRCVQVIKNTGERLVGGDV